MRVPRFYCPQLDPEKAWFELPDTVHRHAIQVLRLKPGALIRLFDGAGQEFEATLTDVAKRHSQVQLGKACEAQTESPLAITLLQSVSRGERMDFAIQKAVELGVRTIVPVVTSRCNVQLNPERAEKRMAHWQGVLISACEQSGRSYLPRLTAVTPLEQALHSVSDEMRLVLDPEACAGFCDLNKPDALTLLIGPEGGLSDEEIELAKTFDFTALRFGPRILRTETAATAALAVVQSLWGDLA